MKTKQRVGVLTNQGMSTAQIAEVLRVSVRQVRRYRQELGIGPPQPDVRHSDDEAGEKWLPVVGYEDRYEVSDRGRVRSLPHVNVDVLGRARPFDGKLLKPNCTGTPSYPSVNLHKGSRVRLHRAHELVLAAFVGPRPAGQVGRHLDDDRNNNHLSNLAYGTPTENAQDALRNGRNYYANLTHCQRGGHEFTPENTWYGARQRICKACFYARKERRAASA